MKKLLLFISFLLVTTIVNAQKYYTKEGIVKFEASVASFEEVKATNNSATAILNMGNGEFAALVFVNGFRFKNALMEEHFNENYAESNQYPKATFKGKIKNYKIEDLKVKKSFMIAGNLSFHGEIKTFDDIPVSISYKNGKYQMSGNFTTFPSDFNIDIPSVVRNKIAKEIEVSFNFNLQKK